MLVNFKCNMKELLAIGPVHEL